jgi:hypothetical protein
MPVVVNEFEATVEPAREPKDGAGGPPREPFPFETRRRLRAVAFRTARVRPC